MRRKHQSWMGQCIRSQVMLLTMWNSYLSKFYLMVYPIEPSCVMSLPYSANMSGHNLIWVNGEEVSLLLVGVMAAIKTLWIISLAARKVNQMIPHLTWQQLLCASCLFFKQTWMESQNYIGIQLSLSSSSWTTFITWSDLSESKWI